MLHIFSGMITAYVGRCRSRNSDFFSIFALMTVCTIFCEMGNAQETGITNLTLVTLAGQPNAGSLDGTGTNASFYYHEALVVDKAGNVYVADSYNSTIRRITHQGVVTTIAGQAGITGTNDGVGANARFSGPRGIARDISGNLYIGDCANHTVRKMTPNGTNWVVTTLAGAGGYVGTSDGTGIVARFNYPEGLVVDAAGTVFVTDHWNHTVRSMKPKIIQGVTNWAVVTLAGQPAIHGTNDGFGAAAQFYYPDGIDVDGSGNLYVVDTYNHTIRKITPTLTANATNWVVTTLAGKPLTSGITDGLKGAARFKMPRGIVLDGLGNAYIGDAYNNTIRRMTLDGVVTTIAGVGGVAGAVDGTGTAARLNHPFGVALDSNGNLYVTDQLNNTIRKGWAVGTSPVFTLGTPTLETNQLSFPLSVVTGPVSGLTVFSSTSLGSSWNPNLSAKIVTNVFGVYYTVRVPLDSGQMEFFRVRTP